jgi:hypothetical protein
MCGGPRGWRAGCGGGLTVGVVAQGPCGLWTQDLSVVLDCLLRVRCHVSEDDGVFFFFGAADAYDWAYELIAQTSVEAPPRTAPAARTNEEHPQRSSPVVYQLI